MIEFHLDARSRVATYLQIAKQVKEALRLGLLDVGDQLPTAREVVADLAINPNTGDCRTLIGPRRGRRLAALLPRPIRLEQPS